MSQALLLLLSGLAGYLATRRTPTHRAWGCVLGLLAQPLWLWSSWQAGQWGVFVLSLGYTYSWATGFVHNVREIQA